MPRLFLDGSLLDVIQIWKIFHQVSIALVLNSSLVGPFASRSAFAIDAVLHQIIEPVSAVGSPVAMYLDDEGTLAGIELHFVESRCLFRQCRGIGKFALLRKRRQGGRAEHKRGNENDGVSVAVHQW